MTLGFHDKGLSLKKEINKLKASEVKKFFSKNTFYSYNFKNMAMYFILSYKFYILPGFG